MAIRLCLKEISVIVINIYNLIGNRQVIVIKRPIKAALNNIKGKIILLRNLNAHYPAWEDRTAA